MSQWLDPAPAGSSWSYSLQVAVAPCMANSLFWFLSIEMLVSEKPDSATNVFRLFTQLLIGIISHGGCEHKMRYSL